MHRWMGGWDKYASYLELFLKHGCPMDPIPGQSLFILYNTEIHQHL